MAVHDGRRRRRRPRPPGAGERSGRADRTSDPGGAADSAGEPVLHVRAARRRPGRRGAPGSPRASWHARRQRRRRAAPERRSRSGGCRSDGRSPMPSASTRRPATQAGPDIADFYADGSVATGALCPYCGAPPCHCAARPSSRCSRRADASRRPRPSARGRRAHRSQVSGDQVRRFRRPLRVVAPHERVVLQVAQRELQSPRACSSRTVRTGRSARPAACRSRAGSGPAPRPPRRAPRRRRRRRPSAAP